MSRYILWLPLGVFALLFGLVAAGLVKPADRSVRSELVGKPLSRFSLPPAIPGKPGLGSAVFTQGEPRLLNVFASWCVPCAAEAPQLMRLRDQGIAIDAVAIRDTPEALTRFLTRYGDPFERIGDDRDSAVQLSLGSSGVPETFVIDGRGIIRHQHLGPLRDEDLPELLAALERAR